jgi:hypothetical protein
MDALDKAVPNDLDEHRIRLERAAHEETLRFDHLWRAFVLRWANALQRYYAAGLGTL